MFSGLALVGVDGGELVQDVTFVARECLEQ